jgi:hypothetical protein
MAISRNKVLGAYVLTAGVLQALLYLWIAFSSNSEWLFYFDPRIGMIFVESVLFGTEEVVLLRWLSVMVEITLGLMLMGDIPVKVYVLFELLFAAPTIFFFVTIALANLSPTHGFSVGELYVPVCVFIVFSVVPLILVFWCTAARRPQSD